MTRIFDTIFDHTEATSFELLPPDVVAKTNAVVADTLGCALLGSADPKAAVFRDIQLSHFGFGGVPVWGTDHLIGWIGAGMANGFQCQMVDCAPVHQEAKTEPTSIILPAVMAYADRFGQVSGQHIITAINTGTDVAVLFALAGADDETFFRSGMCGAFGAGAALAKLAQMDRSTTAEFFGLIDSKLACPKLADSASNLAPSLQIAFGVRNVLTAFDLMRQYIAAPADGLDGPHSYVDVFESGGRAEPLLNNLGKSWRTAEFSFKPVPQEGAVDSMTDEDRCSKFVYCALSAAQPLGKETAERLYARLLAMQDEEDVSVLSALASGIDLEKEIL